MTNLKTAAPEDKNQFIEIELKIHGGPAYHASGEKQLAEYLDFHHPYFTLQFQMIIGPVKQLRSQLFLQTRDRSTLSRCRNK